MPLEFYSGGSAQYQHQDWLGTERVRTTYNGGVEGTFSSLPFGDGYTSTGADNDAYHFAGLDQDNTSNEHAQFREYTDMAGLWMSPDPSSGSYDFTNPQSLNRYSYVTNNPLSMNDPEGLFEQSGGGYGGGGGSCDFICQIVGVLASLFGGGGSGPSFHGSLKPRPDDQPWDEYHIHYGPNIAAALGLPDETCDFGVCGPDPTAVEPGGVAGNAAPIDLSAWVFQIYAFARALNASAPNNGSHYSFFNQWLKDEKSCFGDTGLGTLLSDMNPFSPSLAGAAQSAVNAQSQAFADAAAMQAVERGLTVPLRSPVVRAGLAGSEVLGKVSIGITIVNLVVAGGDAINAEWKQCGW